METTGGVAFLERHPLHDASVSAALNFRAVFDASPRPLLLIAADPPRYTILAVNPVHAQAFGSPEATVTGQGLFDTIPSDLGPSFAGFASVVRASLDRVIATRKPDQMSERAFPAPSPDGAPRERFITATNAPIFGPDGAVAQILIATLDVTGEVLERRGDEARRLLMREVDHRARNALTIVQSFVRLTTAETLEEFRRVVDGRVEALARAQTSLAARRWEGADLAEVVEAELAALSPTGQYRLEGPPLILRAEQVQAMSMSIHELATNAGKYGALSSASGHLVIAWSRIGGGRGRLTWTEAGGPRVTAPTRAGFGSRLISGLATQLGGEIVYDWRPGGLQAALTFQLRTADS